MNCEYLPKANFLTVKNKIELNSQVLVIGTANDPATPYKWAVKLSEILQGAKLISLESDGHTGYNRGNACVNQAVEKYLISGVIPAQNLACSA
jgi:predicted alpha/beta hydrolase family esterase